jgi:acetyl-CoA carboxylase alpha subunit
MEMMALKVPIISILIGEGGSGGALALSAANQVWMLENAVYSVISPEGCASILWKDSSKVKEASKCLKLTAEDLLAMNVIEKIILEDKSIFETLRSELNKALDSYKNERPESIAKSRYNRFRDIG